MSNVNRIKVIAFDLDDTLWHVDPVIIQAEKKLGAWLHENTRGFQYDRNVMAELRPLVLKKDPSLAHRLTAFRHTLIERALIQSGYTAIEAKDIATQAMAVFLKARNEVTFFDGALGVIETLAKRFQLGALSNGNADIARLGLESHFSFAFSAEEVGAPKPAPDLFEAALTHTQIDPHEMVYVGDDPVKDVDAANRLGINTVWLSTNTRPGPPDSEPNAIITDIRDLTGAINQLNAD